MGLVTIDEAKSHLREETEEHDERIEMYIDIASGMILDYLKVASTTYQDTNGDPDDVPAPARLAVLLGISALFENPEQAENGPQVLSPTVKNLLMRLRDPAIA